MGVQTSRSQGPQPLAHILSRIYIVILQTTMLHCETDIIFPALMYILITKFCDPHGDVYDMSQLYFGLCYVPHHAILVLQSRIHLFILGCLYTTPVNRVTIWSPRRQCLPFIDDCPLATETCHHMSHEVLLPNDYAFSMCNTAHLQTVAVTLVATQSHMRRHYIYCDDTSLKPVGICRVPAPGPSCMYSDIFSGLFVKHCYVTVVCCML